MRPPRWFVELTEMKRRFRRVEWALGLMPEPRRVPERDLGDLCDILACRAPRVLAELVAATEALVLARNKRPQPDPGASIPPLTEECNRLLRAFDAALEAHADS